MTASDVALHGSESAASCPIAVFIVSQFTRYMLGRYLMTRMDLTMRWSERRTAVRSTFEMTSTLPLRATRALVRRRSSCSR